MHWPQARQQIIAVALLIYISTPALGQVLIPYWIESDPPGDQGNTSKPRRPLTQFTEFVKEIDGTVWIGNSSTGLYIGAGQVGFGIKSIDKRGVKSISNPFQEVWVLTEENTICRINEESCEPIPGLEALQGKVTAWSSDSRNRTLVLATLSNLHTVSKMDRSRQFRTSPLLTNLEGDKLEKVTVLEDQSIVFSTGTMIGLLRQGDKDPSPLQLPLGRTHLFLESDQKLYILSRVENSNYYSLCEISDWSECYPISEGLVESAGTLSTGEVWYSKIVKEGISKLYRRRGSSSVPVNNGEFEDAAVNTFVVTTDREWVGTTNGVYFRKRGKEGPFLPMAVRAKYPITNLENTPSRGLWAWNRDRDGLYRIFEEVEIGFNISNASPGKLGQFWVWGTEFEIESVDYYRLDERAFSEFDSRPGQFKGILESDKDDFDERVKRTGAPDPYSDLKELKREMGFGLQTVHLSFQDQYNNYRHFENVKVNFLHGFSYKFIIFLLICFGSMAVFLRPSKFLVILLARLSSKFQVSDLLGFSWYWNLVKRSYMRPVLRLWNKNILPPEFDCVLEKIFKDLRTKSCVHVLDLATRVDDLVNSLFLQTTKSQKDLIPIAFDWKDADDEKHERFLQKAYEALSSRDWPFEFPEFKQCVNEKRFLVIVNSDGTGRQAITNYAKTHGQCIVVVAEETARRLPEGDFDNFLNVEKIRSLSQDPRPVEPIMPV